MKPKCLYSVVLIIATLLVISANAIAGIIYSGSINTSFTDSFSVDIDGDDIDDLSFRFEQVSWGYEEGEGGFRFSVDYASDHLQVIGTSFPEPDEVSNLTNGTIIGLDLDPILNWDSGSAHTMAWRYEYVDPVHTDITGPWADAVHGYLGFQIIGASSTNYGWLRMSVTGQIWSATLHDFAIQSSNGESIIAGAIPEPRTLLLLLGGIFLIITIKRHNHGLESTSAPPAAGTLETHP